MQVNFLNSTSPNNKLNKVLTSLFIRECKLLEATSMIKPSLTVSGDVGDFSNVSHCYIEDFERYYFVEDVTIISGSMVRIDLSVDVLESFNIDIGNARGVVYRGNMGNSYIPDNAIAVPAVYEQELIDFGSSLDDTGTFVVTVLGGKAK